MATIKEWVIVGVIIILAIRSVKSRYKIKQVFEAIFSNVNIDTDSMKREIKDAMGEDNGRDKDNKERE